MSAPWFHHNELPAIGDIASLDADEARHVSGARRLGTGASIVLFDGAGGTARAELVEVSKRVVTARVLEREERNMPRPALHLASAPPKGERMSTLLSMSTQLGMTSFTPLTCERGIARPSNTSAERWARISREACKQSRRPHVPPIEPASAPIPLATRLREAGTPVLVPHPGAESLAERLTESGLRSATSIALLVGPEGGFTDDEIAGLHDAGGVLCALGEGILRTETACAAGLALLGSLRA